MTVHDLPALNATLNGLSTALIVSGLICISRRKIKAHITCMVAALVTSAAFLTSYLIYHFQVPTQSSAHMSPVIRWIYWAILFPHILLAMVNLPMIIMTVVAAKKKNWSHHTRRARWTAPIWLYVSVTGVLVYFWLYVWFPAPTP